MRIATPVTRSLVRNDSFGALARVRGRFMKRPYGGETTTRSADHWSATTSGNVRRCEGGGASRREGQAPPLRWGWDAGTRPPCLKGAVTRACERDWGILNRRVPLQIISLRPSVRTGSPPFRQGGLSAGDHKGGAKRRAPLRGEAGKRGKSLGSGEKPGRRGESSVAQSRALWYNGLLPYSRDGRRPAGFFGGARPSRTSEKEEPP